MGNSLWIEDRLLTALNLINALDRLPPFLRERSLAFGLSGATQDVCFIRSDMFGQNQGETRRNSQRVSMNKRGTIRLDAVVTESPRAVALRHRAGGISGWLWATIPNLGSMG